MPRIQTCWILAGPEFTLLVQEGHPKALYTLFISQFLTATGKKEGTLLYPRWGSLGFVETASLSLHLLHTSALLHGDHLCLALPPRPLTSISNLGLPPLTVLTQVVPPTARAGKLGPLGIHPSVLVRIS